MALQQVYSEGPAAGAAPGGWFQVKQQAGASVLENLALTGSGSDYCWRAVMNGDAWLDPFQSPPGFGYLSLLAVAYSGGHGGGVIGSRAYDLRGARFSCEIRADNLRLGPYVNLFWWFQFRDPRALLGKGRYVNLSYLEQTIDGLLGYTAPFERGSVQAMTTNFKPFVINFDPLRPRDWIHMGSAPNKTDIYEDCPSHVADVEHVFRKWDWDCGIIAGYGPNEPVAADYPVGALEIRKMKLEVDDVVNDLTALPPPSCHLTAPASVSAGSTLQAIVTDGPGNPMDWIGLYAAGASDTAFLAWNYLNGTHTVPSSGLTQASVPFLMATPGTYVLRLFANNSFSRLAVSDPVTVS